MDAVQKQVGKGSLCYGKRPYRKGENMALYADIGKAQQLLNWVPTVSLDDGIARTIEWYRELISQEQENICT
jgi:nucleoside-diphosphate-sugar epimerase